MYPTKKQVASKHFFSNTKHAQITNLYLYLVVSTHVKNVRQLELGNLVQIGCENTNLSKEKHLGDHLPFINESPLSVALSQTCESNNKLAHISRNSLMFT